MIPALIDGKKGEVSIEDFNYQYFSTRAGRPGKNIVFLIGDHKIPVTYEMANPVVGLFRVKDFESVYSDQETSDDIMYRLIAVADKNRRKNSSSKLRDRLKSQQRKLATEGAVFDENFDEMKLL